LWENVARVLVEIDTELGSDLVDGEMRRAIVDLVRTLRDYLPLIGEHLIFGGLSRNITVSRH
jgi:hypothetical protein